MRMRVAYDWSIMSCEGVRLWLLLLLCIHLCPSSLSMKPTSTVLNSYKEASGIVVHDWDAIGRVEINQRILMHDAEGVCCGANYTALWDNDDEIIALAVDNFFCPDMMQAIRKHILWIISSKNQNMNWTVKIAT